MSLMRGEKSVCSAFLLLVLSAFSLHFFSFPVSAEECFTDLGTSREALEQALAECQAQIEKNEKILEQQSSERKNTESDILLINNEINKGLVRIRQIDLAIEALGKEIVDKEETVEDLARQLAENQQFLWALLQRINELEQEGFARFLFSNVTLSSFFTRINEYQSLRKTVEDSIRRVGSLRERVAANIDDLEEKKDEHGSAWQQQRATVNQVQSQRKQKQQLLDIQVAQEKQTTEKLSEYESRVAEINNRLFELQGSADISFGQAVQYAREAERATGVRPAFLLGLIKNESDLGKNVGTGNYLTDMHPTRDAPIFPYIAKLLGFKDPSELKVSANPGFGWGGAMGPAQFIPSTWVRFAGLVNAKTGTASPVRNLIQTTRILQVGSTGADVKRLQQFLNQRGFTVATSGAGSPGNESSRYTDKVAAAVSRFQERYANRILRPYGYTRGTGAVGNSTRNAINQLDFFSGPWQYRAEKDLIRKKAGNHRPSNPWNPRDAFFASATYLQQLGAATDECNAAASYYAGPGWRTGQYRQHALNYCRAVASNARIFQRDIDYLDG
ncbi:MAG: lytic murein transglycosylase [Candidatus Kaiserbacteria bacterium]|nr:lytic murein transglycosylase [Candidatus Kaiserbacteria bacterium]